MPGLSVRAFFVSMVTSAVWGRVCCRAVNGRGVFLSLAACPYVRKFCNARTGRFTVQYGPFGLAVWLIWRSKTVCFATCWQSDGWLAPAGRQWRLAFASQLQRPTGKASVGYGALPLAEVAAASGPSLIVLQVSTRSRRALRCLPAGRKCRGAVRIRRC